MQIRTLKKLALALTLWLALHTSTLRAQLLLPLGPYNNSTSTASFDVDSNGLLIAGGTFGTGTGSLNLTGTGTWMVWYPAKAAFRAGYAGENFFVDSAVGNYSAGFGYAPLATGIASFAAGYETQATNYGSTAIGVGNYATGQGATAFGWNTTASGNYATAVGFGSVSSGSASFTTGGNCQAIGDESIAAGHGSQTTARMATAIGYADTASGFCSTVSGEYCNAQATASIATGWHVTNGSFLSFAMGTYNVGKTSSGATSNLNVWVQTDPLFEIGNGSNGSGDGNPAATGPADAFVVYKSGNAAFEGTVTIPQSGDIPMFTGN